MNSSIFASVIEGVAPGSLVEGTISSAIGVRISKPSGVRGLGVRKVVSA